MNGEDAEPVAVAEAAATLLNLAMEESQAPVDQLGNALGRIARALDECTREAEGKRAGSHARMLADIRHVRELLQREVAVCIESLQFHDRLIQQLTHARDCLAALRTDSAPPGSHALADAWVRRHAGEGSVELF